MIDITILDGRYPRGDGDTSPQYHRDMVQIGLRNIGIEPKRAFSNLYIKSRYASVWGWRQSEYLRRKNIDVLVMERGYIGDRFKYTSLGWNGLNGYAQFPDYKYDGLERFHSHGGKIREWKNDGDRIVILGQVPGDASLQGRDLTSWYQNTAAQANKLYGLPVYFRPHPESLKKGIVKDIKNTTRSTGTLKEDLDRALFSIAFNSNALLDSVMYGVPAYAGDRGAMAWDLCSKDLSDIVRPRRDEVLSRISFCQFSSDEIQSGWPIRNLLKMKGIDDLGRNS